MGIDPIASRMLSKRSTIWATPPSNNLLYYLIYVTFLLLFKTIFIIFLVIVDEWLLCHSVTGRHSRLWSRLFQAWSSHEGNVLYQIIRVEFKICSFQADQQRNFRQFVMHSALDIVEEQLKTVNT